MQYVVKWRRQFTVVQRVLRLVITNSNRNHTLSVLNGNLNSNNTRYPT